MPRYHFSCSFAYLGTPRAIHLGMTRWCGALGDTVEVKFKSVPAGGVPPIEFFRQASAQVEAESVWLPFTLRGPSGTGRGTLALEPPSDKAASSRLELQYSVNAQSQGLFVTGEQARHALVSAAVAFEAVAGLVEADDCSDEESSRKYAVFQSLRDLRVPVSFEWVTVLRAADFQAVGWDLASIAALPDIRAGEEGDYVWVVLSDAPFSYKSRIGTEAQRHVETVLDLRGKQQGV